MIPFHIYRFQVLTEGDRRRCLGYLDRWGPFLSLMTTVDEEGALDWSSNLIVQTFQQTLLLIYLKETGF